ncbi:hypothetical protein GCM10009117_16720 [Gangjinia marincola]|uniref:NlpC/P60 domain-containing protein n=1 Tax=Gangjinia marincola TaxID=578463 RepID=A0ABP3XT00_9FLAO
MKAFLTILFLSVLVVSCGSSKRSIKTNNAITSSSSSIPVGSGEDYTLVGARVSLYAKQFEGVKYRYGGNTRKGMDCSGLICQSYLSENITLPRRSRDMSLQGERLKLKEVTLGDLLFFGTRKNSKVINHVGMVVELDEHHIYFIHSTSSRGVIISALDQEYWRKAFVMARRMI